MTIRSDDPRIREALEAIERVILEHVDALVPHTDVDGDWTPDSSGEPLADATLAGWVLVCDWTSLSEGPRSGAVAVESLPHVTRPYSIGLLQLALDSRRGVGD